MTDNTAVKTGIAAAYAVLSGFFGNIFQQVFGLLIVMIAFMALDWLTGMAKASKTKTISSKVGVIGILKKGLCIAVVLVAFGVDFVISYTAEKIGVSFTSTYVTILVVVWLIVNEGISILENIGELGVKYPPFLTKIFKSLKTTVEKQVKVDNETEGK